MKLLFTATAFLWFYGIGFTQPIVTIAGKQTTARYLQATSGALEFPVEVTVNYNGAEVKTNDTLHFLTVHSTNIALITDSQRLSPVILPASDFGLVVKQKKLTLNVTMKAIRHLDKSEFFDIVLIGDKSGQSHRVVIEPIALGQPATSVFISHIKAETIYEPPLERDIASTDTRHTWLRYHVDGVLENDTTVELELLSNAGNSIITELETKAFRIPRSRTLSGSYTDSIEVYYKIHSIKGFGKDETVYLKMKNNNTRDFIIYTRSKLVNPNKAFWIEAGSNFDLIDGIRPNNFFAGVFLYKRDIRDFSFSDYTTIKDTLVEKEEMIDGKKQKKFVKEAIPPRRVLKEKKNLNLSIMAGIYESRSIGSESGSSAVTYQDNRSLTPDTANRYAVFKDTGTITQTTSITNLGLFFSPQIRITNGSANSDGFHVFASLWTEVIWQRSETLFDYSKTSNLRTMHVKEDSLIYFEKKQTKAAQDYRTHYLGLGLPMYLKDGDINVYFSPIVGATNQRFNLPQNQLTSTDLKLGRLPEPPRDWNVFYLMMFRLSEEKYGISFTGEVRGLIIKESKPVISLALSKKFDLSKLLEYK